MAREVAWRIFAFEFNRSNLYISKGDERAPNYIITPTGVKCNRLFIIGVVTEVEKENNVWRARVADPTGVFTIYAGQYQPEAAIFLSELQVPAYVAVVGKARKFEPEDSVYVRPEEINSADEKLRDRWVLDTAERTLERIGMIEEVLGLGLSGEELREHLQRKKSSLVEGAALAVEHYKNLNKIIEELKNALIHAVEIIAHKKHEELPEEKEVLMAIIDKLDTGNGTSYDEVIEAASVGGISSEQVELYIRELMAEGRCYEPKIGVLRKVQ